MNASPTDRFERVRESLLHLGLRQITEEPGLDQPADFARRKARFEQNRQDLDNFRAKQSAARAAAEAKTDDELRARLEGQNGMISLQCFLMTNAEPYRTRHRSFLRSRGNHFPRYQKHRTASDAVAR